MMYQLTNEQATQLFNLMVDVGESNCAKEVSEWLSANLPAPIPVLRPIQEMPREVPEGATRLFGCLQGVGEDAHLRFGDIRDEGDTVFIDVHIPFLDPEAKLRWEFEAWFNGGPMVHKSVKWNGITYPQHDMVWRAYKAGKEAQRG